MTMSFKIYLIISCGVFRSDQYCLYCINTKLDKSSRELKYSYVENFKSMNQNKGMEMILNEKFTFKTTQCVYSERYIIKQILF